MDMLHLLLESCGFNIERHTTFKNYMMDITSKPGFFILLHQPLHCQVFLHQLSACTGVKASEGSRAKGAESDEMVLAFAVSCRFGWRPQVWSQGCVGRCVRLFDGLH